MSHWISRLFSAALLLVLFWGCGKPAQKSAPAPPPAPPASDRSDPAATSPASAGDSSHRSQQFEPAFFAFDSAVLDEAARTRLDEAARLLRSSPATRLLIEGHCDERGTVEYNAALGERRARMAKDYLVDSGIEPGRLEIISYGKERPFEPGHGEHAWALNRRAQLVGR